MCRIWNKNKDIVKKVYIRWKYKICFLKFIWCKKWCNASLNWITTIYTKFHTMILEKFVQMIGYELTSFEHCYKLKKNTFFPVGACFNLSPMASKCFESALMTPLLLYVVLMFLPETPCIVNVFNGFW